MQRILGNVEKISIKMGDDKDALVMPFYVNKARFKNICALSESDLVEHNLTPISGFKGFVLKIFNFAQKITVHDKNGEEREIYVEKAKLSVYEHAKSQSDKSKAPVNDHLNKILASIKTGSPYDKPATMRLEIIKLEVEMREKIGCYQVSLANIKYKESAQWHQDHPKKYEKEDRVKDRAKSLELFKEIQTLVKIYQIVIPLSDALGWRPGIYLYNLKDLEDYMI